MEQPTQAYEYPKYYHVRFTNSIVAGTDFFENLIPTDPTNLNSDDPYQDPVEITVEHFVTLIQAMRRAADVIEELETPVQGWVEIMVYYWDEEDTSPNKESLFTFFRYNPEIGI